MSSGLACWSGSIGNLRGPDRPGFKTAGCRLRNFLHVVVHDTQPVLDVLLEVGSNLGIVPVLRQPFYALLLHG